MRLGLSVLVIRNYSNHIFVNVSISLVWISLQQKSYHTLIMLEDLLVGMFLEAMADLYMQCLFQLRRFRVIIRRVSSK